MMQKQTSNISGAHKGDQAVRLRLYVAHATPNSIRAQQNLSVALDTLGGACKRLELEIVDVFSQPKRAINDGVIVTPTLIGLKEDGRVTMMGDLSDSVKLKLLLESLTA